MKVKILSFDTGTESTGWSIIEGNIETSECYLTPNFGVIKTTKKDGTVRERIDIIGNKTAELVEIHQPTHMVMEDFTEQGKITGTVYKEMAWLTEHMRMKGRELGHEVTIYENAYWKKIATGASRINKYQIKHFVAHEVPKAEKLLGTRTAQHVWDSVGIGYAKFIELQGAY